MMANSKEDIIMHGTLKPLNPQNSSGLSPRTNKRATAASNFLNNSVEMTAESVATSNSGV